MIPMQRLRLGDLDLSHHDVFERDIEYIYDEIFSGAAYDHPHIKLPERPTIIDVGANVGLYSIWAARKYQPQTMLAFEASPSTFECLVDNVERHISRELTTASSSISLFRARQTRNSCLTSRLGTRASQLCLTVRSCRGSTSCMARVS